MKFPRRIFFHLTASAAALFAVSRIARARAYPTRPVRFIVPFPPGGSADPIARVLANRLSAVGMILSFEIRTAMFSASQQFRVT